MPSKKFRVKFRLLFVIFQSNNLNVFTAYFFTTTMLLKSLKLAKFSSPFGFISLFRLRVTFKLSCASWGTKQNRLYDKAAHETNFVCPVFLN